MSAVRVSRVLIAIVALLFTARLSAAQDVAITNARIVVGNGQVINSGTIVVPRRQDRIRVRRGSRHARGCA
jgi:hypothetical protein